MPDEDNKTMNNAQNVVNAQNVTIINNYGAEAIEDDEEMPTTYKKIVQKSEEAAPGLSEGLRVEVARFAVAMEKKLTERDHLWPNGWAGDNQDELLAKASNKFVVFAQALKGDTATANIRELGVDIANYVMMLVDNAGGLLKTQ